MPAAPLLARPPAVRVPARSSAARPAPDAERLADFAAALEIVTDEAEVKKYDATANSAQKFPARQG